MSRETVLDRYRPIRAGIRRVLHSAGAACRPADLRRAAKQLGVLDETLNDEVVEMLADIALFEPNQRGRRAFDRFLAERGERLSAADRALAQRMAGAWFSIFRLAGRHDEAGLWLEDLLDGNRRLWLMDEALEATAFEGALFGMRLFDADPFHAGFGIIVPPEEDILVLCQDARARGAPLPLRESLAATLYGDHLQADSAGMPDDMELMQTFLELLMSEPTPPTTAPPRMRRPRKKPAARRK